jgi:hypothetical protein
MASTFAKNNLAPVVEVVADQSNRVVVIFIKLVFAIFVGISFLYHWSPYFFDAFL